jgi:uncharacterized damage-inducible protein DinB
MGEAKRIAGQLRNAYEGPAWHGPSLRELLHNVSATQAVARSREGVHNIWELVAHVITWERVSMRRIAGEQITSIPPEVNFPTINQADDVRWQRMLDELASVHRELMDVIVGLGDDQLSAQIPTDVSGQMVSVYVTLHGIIQHNLYHAGQIALLKKL